MAADLPNSRFVGIDLSARQIEEGRATISEHGLVNIELLHKSISDVGPDMGKFDSSFAMVSIHGCQRTFKKDTGHQPLYFHEFVERADQAGLRFLANSDIRSMVADHLNSPGPELLKGMPLVRREQY